MILSSLGAISPLEEVSRYTTDNPIAKAEIKTDNTASFDTILNSAINMVKETDDLSNAVETEEIKYAMGESDSMHDLLIAQQKANVSLQYTVAVKNTAVEAYKTLMNMQF